jgi:hypothetical protein
VRQLRGERPVSRWVALIAMGQSPIRRPAENGGRDTPFRTRRLGRHRQSNGGIAPARHGRRSRDSADDIPANHFRQSPISETARLRRERVKIKPISHAAARRQRTAGTSWTRGASRCRPCSATLKVAGCAFGERVGSGTREGGKMLAALVGIGLAASSC